MNIIINDLLYDNNIKKIEKKVNHIDINIDNGNTDLKIALKNENNNRIYKIYGFIICIPFFIKKLFNI